MTCIVFRDGILAADTRAYSGNFAPIGQKSKIKRLTDGSLMGVGTNQPGLGEALIAWVDDGMKIEDFPSGETSFQALLVRPNGEVFYFHDSSRIVGPLTAPFFAIGSGTKYALGAFSCGLTAVRAVYVAIEHDTWSAAPVEHLELVQPVVEIAVGRKPKLKVVS